MVKRDFEAAPPAEWNFDRAAIASLLDKVGRTDRSVVMPQHELTFNKLKAMFNDQEAAVLDQLLAIDPVELGFTGPFITLDGPSAELAPLSFQAFNRDGKETEIAQQHLPREAMKAFYGMKAAIKQDIGSRLMVESGYRSPAYQAIVLLACLERDDFDIKAVARGVALPGYSQHGDPINTAMDVLNQDGIPTDEGPERFEDTKEYEWLVDNAARFGFHLSYPGDVDGIKFEPWHWRFIASDTADPH